MKTKYCASLSDDLFNIIYDTKEEAIKDMTIDLENGDEFYIGEVKPTTIDDVKNACNFIDNESIGQYFWDEIGEVSEDWLLGIKEEEWDELRMIVARWLWRKDKPEFYSVENIEKITVKK